ncbi:MAG: cupredoxin domain-containing protein [Chloroflexota bacterium]|nr:cupredoxin domain-containing protein [Chloroflexota bacterium]
MATFSISPDSATMSRRILLTGAVASTSALVLAACGGTAEGGPVATVTRVPAEGAPPTQPPAASPGATPAAAATPARGEATPDASPVTESTPEAAATTVGPLIAVDIGWRLDDLATMSGDAITLTVTPGTTFEMVSEAVTEHDFTVDELSVHVVVAPGETVTVTIPDDATPGEYEFYCSVPGHRAAGMVGTLIVQEAGAEPGAAPAADEAADASPAPAEAAAAAVGPLVAFDIGWRLGDLSTPADAITLTVAPGTTFELVSEGAALHDFVVDALGIDVDIEPGATTSATIPDDAAPGEYEFYCSVPGHAAAGMVGTLVIA